MMIPEAGPSIDSGRVVHVLWRTIIFPSIGVACMCLWSDTDNSWKNAFEQNTFSVHFTTNIGDYKLSTNVVYGRNGLRETPNPIHAMVIIALHENIKGRGVGPVENIRTNIAPSSH